jgi:hypothetical protein
MNNRVDTVSYYRVNTRRKIRAAFPAGNQVFRARKGSKLRLGLGAGISDTNTRQISLEGEKAPRRPGPASRSCPHLFESKLLLDVVKRDHRPPDLT